eukprot:scaffold3761_cov134-Skeletonema_dohrnii-CCMP3373.AAC.3
MEASHFECLDTPPLLVTVLTSLCNECKIVMQHIDASCMPMMRQLSIFDGVDCKMSFNCVLVS